MDLMILNTTRGIKPFFVCFCFLFFFYFSTCSSCSFLQLSKHIILFRVSTQFMHGPSSKFYCIFYSFFIPTKLFTAVKISSKGNIQSTRRTNALLEYTTFRVCEILFPNNLTVSLFYTSVIFFNHSSYLCI